MWGKEALTFFCIVDNNFLNCHIFNRQVYRSLVTLHFILIWRHESTFRALVSYNLLCMIILLMFYQITITCECGMA